MLHNVQQTQGFVSYKSIYVTHEPGACTFVAGIWITQKSPIPLSEDALVHTEISCIIEFHLLFSTQGY